MIAMLFFSFSFYPTSSDTLATGQMGIPQINLFQREFWGILLLWDIYCWYVETGNLCSWLLDSYPMVLTWEPQELPKNQCSMAYILVHTVFNIPILISSSYIHVQSCAELRVHGFAGSHSAGSRYVGTSICSLQEIANPLFPHGHAHCFIMLRC